MLQLFDFRDTRERRSVLAVYKDHACSMYGSETETILERAKCRHMTGRTEGKGRKVTQG